MKIQSVAFVLGVVGALAFAACKSSGAGGEGGGGCAHTVGDGGGFTYYTPGCEEAITQGGVPCSDDAAGLTAYNALVSCASASCAPECADLVASQGPADPTCSSCLTAHCDTPLGACRLDACYPGNC